MANHDVVSREAWLAARKALLLEEKEFTRLRDRLSQRRRDLPWERVDKPYVFEGPDGKETLAELFGGRSQLVVYHFMFGPDWEAPCKSCSFWADNFERNVVHLAHRDVTLIAVYRAPLTRHVAFKGPMGWTIKWVSSAGSAYKPDYRVLSTADGLAKGVGYYYYAMQKNTVSELPGISVFYKDPDGTVFHTYSCYARGLDMMNAAYQYLDLVPKGRDEAEQRPYPMAWLRYRDSYER